MVKKEMNDRNVAQSPWSVGNGHCSAEVKTLIIKEPFKAFDSSRSYEISDPSNGNIVAKCSEKLSLIRRIMRNLPLGYCSPLDMKLEFKGGDVIYITRTGITLWMSTLKILDKGRKIIATFKQERRNFKDIINVLDVSGNLILKAEEFLEYSEQKRQYNIFQGKNRVAQVRKVPQGILKNLTEADDYTIEFFESLRGEQGKQFHLLLALAITIDTLITDKFRLIKRINPRFYG